MVTSYSKNGKTVKPLHYNVDESDEYKYMIKLL